VEKHKILVVSATLLALLGLLLGACGPKQEGLPLEEQPYRNDLGGYTIRYPKDWLYDAYGGQVMFYESEEAAMTEVPSTPIVLLEVATIDELDYSYVSGISEAKDSRAMLQILVDDLRGQGEVSVGATQDLTVGGSKAAAADIRGTEQGLDIAGRVVCVHLGDRGGVFVAVGAREDWDEFVPTFEAMLGSMAFER